MVGNPDLTRTRYEMDQQMADVLPEDHEVHARIQAFEMAEDLPEKAREFAVTLADQVAGGTPESPEACAKAAVKKAKEEFL